MTTTPKAVSYYGRTNFDRIAAVEGRTVWSASSYDKNQDVPVARDNVLSVEDIEDVFGFDLLSQPIMFTPPVVFDESGVTQPETIQIAGKKQIFRSGGTLANGQPAPAIPLSIMGDKYRINPFREYFTGLAEVLIDLGCEVLFAGTLAAGQRGYMSVSLPGNGSDLNLPGAEAGRTLLHVGDSVNGTTSSRASLGMERLSCMNAIHSRLFGMSAIWSVRHTANAGLLLNDAHQLVTDAVAASNLMSDRIQRLANETYVESQFRGLIKSLQGERPAEECAAQTRWDSKFDAIMSRYNVEAQSSPAIAGTKYHALQTLDGWSTHNRGTRKGTTKLSRSINETIFSSSNAFLEKATNLVLA